MVELPSSPAKASTENEVARGTTWRELKLERDTPNKISDAKARQTEVHAERMNLRGAGSQMPK
jgi:hypothetical protein